MALPPEKVVERFRRLRRRAGIFLDFDGTLSDIAPRPELARPRPEAPRVLSALAQRYALVAVVSARPAEVIRSLLRAPDVQVFGLYGLSESAPPSPQMQPAREAAVAAARLVEGARVEDKGRSVAVHYREAADPARAAAVLSERLSAAAAATGMALIAGKMVFELASCDVPGKGSVIKRECRTRALRGCLFAGDDLADLDAFSALDRLQREGLTVAKVAVRSGEAPAELIEAADAVVDGPRGLMELLARL